MNIEDVKKVAVMGSGEMGHGIAEVLLLSGYKVNIRDVEQKFLDRGLTKIKESFDKMEQKQKLSSQKIVDMMRRINTYLDVGRAVDDVDFIIEAVPEIKDVKREVFKEIDRAAPQHAIIASNTSGINISELAAATKRPEKVLGMHFINPVIMMKLVEVIKARQTAAEAVRITYDLAIKIGKAPIIVKKDSPGFVFTRLNAPRTILLGLIIEKGIAAPEEIDARMKETGMPMGPYELMDFIGLDILYHGNEYFSTALSPDYKPPEWLKKKVDQGNLGRKTGMGIYDWSKGRPSINPALAKKDFDPNNFLAIQVNEATKLIEEDVVSSAEDIDKAVVNGGGGESGPLQRGKEIGYAKLADLCQTLADKFGIETFKPTETLKSGKLLS